MFVLLTVVRSLTACFEKFVAVYFVYITVVLILFVAHERHHHTSDVGMAFPAPAAAVKRTKYEAKDLAAKVQIFIEGAASGNISKRSDGKVQCQEKHTEQLH